MKLSKKQARVVKLMQEGWELGSDLGTIGHTVVVETGRLQKHGLGHGDPCERVKIGTIQSLVRRGFIEKLPNMLVMVEPTRYRLTEKGKEWKE